MLIIVWATQAVARLRGMVEEIGWGFIIFTGESPVLVFLTSGSPMKVNIIISLKSLPDSTTYLGSYGNMGNILLFPSRGFASSSSSDYVDIRTFFFFLAGPKLSPMLSSCTFFFRISTGKM
jgi:hypothetical protein